MSAKLTIGDQVTLSVVNASGAESSLRYAQWTCYCYYPQPLDLDNCIDVKAQLQLEEGHCFYGITTHCSAIDTNYYQIEISSRAHRLDRSVNYFVFYSTEFGSVINKVCQRYSELQPKIVIKTALLNPLSFIQYNETDWAFIQRLCAQFQIELSSDDDHESMVLHFNDQHQPVMVIAPETLFLESSHGLATGSKFHFTTTQYTWRPLQRIEYQDVLLQISSVTHQYNEHTGYINQITAVTQPIKTTQHPTPPSFCFTGKVISCLRETDNMATVHVKPHWDSNPEQKGIRASVILPKQSAQGVIHCLPRTEDEVLVKFSADHQSLLVIGSLYNAKHLSHLATPDSNAGYIRRTVSESSTQVIESLLLCLGDQTSDFQMASSMQYQEIIAGKKSLALQGSQKIKTQQQQHYAAKDGSYRVTANRITLKVGDSSLTFDNNQLIVHSDKIQFIVAGKLSSQPLVLIGDQHQCPKTQHKKPHGIGSIIQAHQTVKNNGKNIICVGDKAYCSFEMNHCSSGLAALQINQKPVVIEGEATAHGGHVTKGSGTVSVAGSNHHTKQSCALMKKQITCLRVIIHPERTLLESPLIINIRYKTTAGTYETHQYPCKRSITIIDIDLNTEFSIQLHRIKNSKTATLGLRQQFQRLQEQFAAARLADV